MDEWVATHEIDATSAACACAAAGAEGGVERGVALAGLAASALALRWRRRRGTAG
jgi:hypothetical protein